MTVETTGASRGTLIEQLFVSETCENNDLTAILGSVKPTKSSKSPLVSILRGLYTKNTKLLQLLNGYRDNAPEPDCEAEQFKSFVNEFIIWMDNGGIVLYNKFLRCFHDKNLVLQQNIAKYSKPIRNAVAYVSFMDGARQYIRNPFVVDKLVTLSGQFGKVVAEMDNLEKALSLRNISFLNVAAYPWQSSSTKVASYFSPEQIVDRSLGAFTLDRRGQVEIALLNLADQGEKGYDAMALLEIGTSNTTSNGRSLLFPPCRINELFVEFRDDAIVLRPLNFSAEEPTVAEASLVLRGNVTQAKEWFNKLVPIFPSRYGECLPMSPTSITPLSGLGINIYLSSGASSPELEVSEDRNLAIESPPLRSPQRMAPPPPVLLNKSHLSNSSISSSISTESTRNQNERSLNILHKTLSGSQASETGVKQVARKTFSAADELTVPETSRPRSERAEVDYGTPSSSVDDKNDPVGDSETPLATQYAPENGHKFLSAPELGATQQPRTPGIFQLSNGLAINISSFGQTHKPSFSVAHGLNSIVEPEKKKKSFLGLFRKREKGSRVREGEEREKGLEGTKKKEKRAMTSSREQSLAKEASNIAKTNENSHPQAPHSNQPAQSAEIPEPSCAAQLPSSPPSRNVKDLTIKTELPRSIDLAEPLSTISERSDTGRSALPSPFALPSSTSTYFFKPYLNDANGSCASVASQKETEALVIPQHLKDTINDDETIDFYISPTSPKALKVSSWKEKYGKWEMLTTSDCLFVKMVVNYASNRAWMIVYKEEHDEIANELVDQPLLIVSISPEHTHVRQLSALDVQLSTVNAVTNDKMRFLFRCGSGKLAHALVVNLGNIHGVLTGGNAKTRAKTRDLLSQNSSQTLTSSVMDGSISKSTTVSTTLSSVDSPAKQFHKDLSLQTCCSDDITRAHVLANPENSRMMVINRMKVRLQRLTEGYERIQFSSSWKIVSMCALTVHIISDHFTDANYYHLVLENLEDNNSENLSWLFKEDSKFTLIEKVGRAGMLVKLQPEELYMLECRGKKELKTLLEVF